MMAQINAAHRSFVTNVLLITTLILISSLLAFVPKPTGTVYSAMIASVFKTAFPILTSLANFGTIQSVGLKYWTNFKHRFV